MNVFLDVMLGLVQRRHLLLFLLATCHATTGWCGKHDEDNRRYYGSDASRMLALNDPWGSAPRIAREPAAVRYPGQLLDCRLPGEFESQRGLLLPCNPLLDNAPDLFLDIVQHTSGKLEIVALVSNRDQWEAAKRLLRANSVALGHVRFVELPHDTMWARDYGPIIVRSRKGRPIVIDADYELSRANDDRVPAELARLLDVHVVQMPLRLDGGNLLSNGDGLAITTCRVLDNNVLDGQVDEEGICAILRASLGLRQVVVLEPLVGEPTGHVDMFATFTSPNTVVVGQYDPEVDPDNAAILDRNADQLANIRTTTGRLRVVRIPMATHDDGLWRTYTNVVYANGVLLVPAYNDTDQEQWAQVLRIYRKLLPRWKIVGVDSSRIIESCGALHCITMNLGPLGRLPNFPAPRTPGADQPDFIADGALTWTVEEQDSFAQANSLAGEADGTRADRPRPWGGSTVGFREEYARSRTTERKYFRGWELRERRFAPDPSEAVFEIGHLQPSVTWPLPHVRLLGKPH